MAIVEIVVFVDCWFGDVGYSYNAHPTDDALFL